MMGSTSCFTTISVFKPQNPSRHFSNLSNNVTYLFSKSPNLLFSASTSSDSGIRLKSATLLPRATHLQVSEDAPIEESEPSSPTAIGQHDLLIVGPGVLGRLVAEKWREENPGCQVYGQTRTTDHHDELVQMCINPSLKWTESTHMFPYVIYCAPPSRTSDYSGNIRQAALSWNGEGSFLFTSSSAPYDCNDNGPCDEDTPSAPIGRSPRTDILLNAEKVVLESGGCVLRLAGLYDAASLTVAILKEKIRGKIFLGCDNHPLSRQEMMDLINRSGKFSKKFDKFTGTNDPLGKRLNNSKTRKEIGWEPKYPSFAHFLETI